MISPKDFSYQLPDEYIAQIPASPRDSAKLMMVDRQTDSITHHVFRDILDILTPNDVLVINDSKVFPARLIGKKESGGRAEVLLLRPLDDNTWEAMSNGLKPTQTVFFDGNLTGHVENKNEATGHVTITLSFGLDQIEQIGHTPIPPYIHSHLSEQALRQEYQNVYAN